MTTAPYAIDPAQIIYDVIEDAMTPAAYDSHHGGYWLSDLPPDLLAQRIATALRDHLTSTDTSAGSSTRSAPCSEAPMPDARDTIDPDAWPAEAEGITTRAIREALPDLPPSAPNIIARRIMADLTTAGHTVLDEIEDKLRAALEAKEAHGG